MNGKTAEGKAYSAYMVIDIEDGIDAKFAKSLNATINGVRRAAVIRSSDKKFTAQTRYELFFSPTSPPNKEAKNSTVY